MSAVEVVKADARSLPLPEASVDLIVTSPPYWGQRSYEDGGTPVAGQIGQEATVGGYVAALVETTREMLRVLRPAGSLWVNLGDRYVDRSLSGAPWRYALACTDDLGLTLRAEVVWSKPNGFIDAKARDRVRRTHETWLHLTRPGRHYGQPRRLAPTAEYQDRPQYRRAEELFAHAGLTPAHREAVRAVGIIDSSGGTVRSGGRWDSESGRLAQEVRAALGSYYREFCGSSGTPSGVIPGSVREVAAHPFKVPKRLGVTGHFASFPVEWPLWIIDGWCPPGGVVLDPFGGTGTTALAALVLDRQGITVDSSADYCRIAEWRTTDPTQIARARRLAPEAPDA
ncbi:site-specific DNA-methyltransferase [Cellulomonas sp. C5510]|uniref:DNA-methyltransferase n=1 Tax=Cellulomonas sp. C5510 TaxID=2871170 RepID=UPI001C93CE21|nr:site-specific DNA-methyltransferase [Cellulomonas sp. C5510]QZN86913.1 site-specific DNA-methyltransferase [Cellulomonas sp. C5510]